ncbi:MAG: hypothetical protein AB7J13_16030 [Pyrinomonadaceae bacterium]
MAEIEQNQNASEPIVVDVEEMVAWDLPPANRPRKVYSGMWGPLEIGVVAAGVLAVVAAAVLYFLVVVPSNRELAKNRTDADRLEAELISADTKYGEITTTQSQVAKIVSSVDDFEARFLPVVSTGQAALYQRLNSLILAHGLVNSTGPDYAPLETADRDTGDQTEEEKGRGKYRSLYPGVYVTTTVEGTYQNLRRFLRDVETGREFIIVSAVELAPSDSVQPKDEVPQTAAADPYQAAPASPNTRFSPNSGFPPGLDPRLAQAQQPTRREKGKMHGELVSLRIEMASYFRRPNFVPAEPVE